MKTSCSDTVTILHNGQVVDEAKGLFQTGEPRAAVAFWGTGAASRLGLTDSNNGGRIICNLRMGGTNPEEIRLLIESGLKVRQCDILHSKVYIGDTGAIVGSSNASANGLSFQEAECGGWIETNVLLKPSPPHSQLISWFEDLWNSEHVFPITDQDLEVAADAWTRRRRTTLINGARYADEGVLPSLLRDPDSLSDKRIYLTLYFDDASEEAFKAIEKERAAVRAAGGEPKDLDFFEDWDDLPSDADLICFYVGPRGRIRHDNVWTITTNRKNIALKDGNITLCWRSALQLSKREIPDWSPIIKRVLAQYPSRDGMYLDLKEVYRSFIAEAEIGAT